MSRLSTPARELVTLIRRHRLNYDALRNVLRSARQVLKLEPPKSGRRLPRLLTDAQLAAFFKTIDDSGNLQHQLLLRLMFYTGLRVSELCAIRVADVDLAAGRIYVERGKGDKDRYVVFPEAFGLTLKAYLYGAIEHRLPEDGEHLFESRQHRAYSRQRIGQIIAEYASAAGLERVHPHLLRHQCLTYLTRSGLKDSQIQLISGHSSKKSLERYQHLSLGDVQPDYETAMRKVQI